MSALERLGLARDASHLDVAREVARTCVAMYARTPTGLAPEIAHFPLSGLAKKKGTGELVSGRVWQTLPATSSTAFWTLVP